ncbi:glycine/D-amino acid oxidase-like deaminating enzyme [Salinibacter ruber]|nr:FAD-binding oxidoreductase [Salinibacter ruber]MCS4116096.1 glycine/D-amino acid oxidase-like deaminating enzyme [Salinibacter ruber]
MEKHYFTALTLQMRLSAMDETADIIIIGGGVMGTSTALHLAEQGVGEVLLLEKSSLGAGSSGKSGAILRQHYSHEVSVRMARTSLQFYENFQARYDREIGFCQPGMLFIANEAQREALERNVELQRSLGVDTQILDAAALRAAEPHARFADDALGAWEPEAAYVNPVKTVHGLAAAAQEAGATIRTGIGAAEVLRDGGAVRGVRTDGDTKIRADVVVNTAGPWAGQILDQLGLDYPLQVVRPEQAFFEPPADVEERPTMYADLLNGVYWKPEQSDWVRVGKLAFDDDEEVTNPDHYDEGVSNDFVSFAHSALTDRLPAFEHAVSWGGCGALYTVTPDSHPLVGAVPEVEGLYLASGFSGHGFKLAPAVGRGLTGLITETDPAPFDPDFLAVDRLRHDRPVTVPYSYSILG